MHLLVHLLCGRRDVFGITSCMYLLLVLASLDSVLLGLVRCMDILRPMVFVYRTVRGPGERFSNDEESVDAGRVYSHSALELSETA